jgi:hypothetical protein
MAFYNQLLVLAGIFMGNHSGNGAGTIDPQACWSVLERVAATPSLKRATRLREFLLYVGVKSLQEGRTDIHEQEIGESVFGRPRDYETSQDNIVRVSATELRKRVDAYFASEGIGEPIIFEIPRGSYLPLFHVRKSAEDPNPDISFSPASSQATSGARKPVLIWLVSALAILLAVFCILLWRQNENLRQRIQVLEHSTSHVHPDGPLMISAIKLSNGS